MKKFGTLLILFSLAFLAIGANNVVDKNVYDPLSIPPPKFKTTDTGGIHTPHVIVDSGGSGSASGAGAATISTAQVTLSTTASVVAAASATRRSVIIRNHDASISIYVGITGVTTSTGFLVKAGEALSINTVAAVYAVAASGAPVASRLSEND